MSLSEILKLGDPRLHQVSLEVKQSDLPSYKPSIEIMHNAIMDFRALYGAGRGVAAPQIGVFKRFIYLYLDKPYEVYNPVLFDYSEEKVELWDDCLCFPGLLIKVRRSKSVKMKFRDENWEEQIWELDGDLSELIQHEYDHLDGILATQRAVDEHSFKMINPN